MSVVFRIAHLSDLHFGGVADRLNPLDGPGSNLAKARVAFSVLAKHRSIDEVTYPSTFNSEVALNLLLDMDDQARHCNAIVVTGDLATTGSDADLSIAREYFDGKLAGWVPAKAELPSICGRASCPLFALPGNHDRYDGRALIPGGRGFERFFGINWDFGSGAAHDTESTIGQSRAKYGLLATPDRKHALLVCFADFSLDYASSGDGLKGWIGQGTVESPAFNDLLNTTAKVSSELREAGVDFGVVWAVHFPPSFDGVDPDLELIDGQRLVDAARELGAAVILAGHTHEARLYNPLEKVLVCCSGASSGKSVHEEYSYAFLDFEVEQGVRRVSRILRAWDDTRGAFTTQEVEERIA